MQDNLCRQKRPTAPPEPMSSPYCPDCDRATEVVLDHSAGDTQCSECGLILKDHSNEPDPVGGPIEPVLLDLNWSTGDRSLIQAFKKIDTMADRLGLGATVKDRANEIYKKVEDHKHLKGRNQDAYMAACVYIACREGDKPRTVKEICSVAHGVTKKEIGRAKKFIVRQLELEMGQAIDMGTIHAGDFLRRFCSNLSMNNQSIKAAQEAVQKSEELDVRRSPVSIAAAVMYMITQLSDDKKILRNIAFATGVAESTIRNSYKDLYPFASRIVPSWYSKEEDLKQLCNP